MQGPDNWRGALSAEDLAVRGVGIESCVARTVARISVATHFNPNYWQGTRLRCAPAGCASFKV